MVLVMLDYGSGYFSCFIVQDNWNLAMYFLTNGIKTLPERIYIKMVASL